MFSRYHLLVYSSDGSGRAWVSVSGHHLDVGWTLTSKAHTRGNCMLLQNAVVSVFVQGVSKSQVTDPGSSKTDPYHHTSSFRFWQVASHTVEPVFHFFDGLQTEYFKLGFISLYHLPESSPSSPVFAGSLSFCRFSKVLPMLSLLLLAL